MRLLPLLKTLEFYGMATPEQSNIGLLSLFPMSSLNVYLVFFVVFFFASFSFS